MKCNNCGHEQETGKFCGKCGSPLEVANLNTNETISPPIKESFVQPEKEQAATSAQQPVQPAEPNAHVENVKVKSKAYFAYFMRYLKNPTLAYNRSEAEFSNSLISIILLTILMVLSLFTFTSKVFGSFSSDYGPGFFSFFIGVFLFIAAAIGIVLLSLFLINKFFGPGLSFNSVVSLYGAHLSPVLIVAVVSLILMILSSFTFGNFTLSLAFMFVIFVLPLYLISVLLTKKSSGIDPLYAYISYITLFTILFIIFATILADSSFGIYLDDFTNWY